MGAVTLIFGIIPIAAISNYWVNQTSCGIWFGVWIIVTGIIGVCSVQIHKHKEVLNAINLSFNIVCAVISFIAAGLFIVGIV